MSEVSPSKTRLAELLTAWDALRDSKTIMENSGCDFGHVLSLRAAIISQIVEAVREFVAAPEPVDPPYVAYILDLLAWAHSKLRAFGVHTGKPESAMRMDAIELELRSHSRGAPETNSACEEKL